jgi:hypothetical protein
MCVKPVRGDEWEILGFAEEENEGGRTEQIYFITEDLFKQKLALI